MDNQISTIESKPKSNSEAFRKSIVSFDEMTGDVFRLSKTEELVCEVYAETGSMKACIDACKAQLNRKIKYMTIRRWLDTKPLIRKHVLKLLQDKGKAKMSYEEWMGGMQEIVRGDRKIASTTPYMYKLIGEAKGWFKEVEGKGISVKNVQINILQQNGMA